MPTDNKTRKQLRAIGHHLNVIVIVSNGLKKNVSGEIDRALNDHELIKIRINANDREEKLGLVSSICKKHNAELIQMSGHVALLLRHNPEAKPELSNLVRHQHLMASKA